MTSVITASGQLEITVFTGGVIPVMYPDALPRAVHIQFEFMPRDGAAFGALMLSEDPGDGILDHYVAVWASPTAGKLTVIPFDAAAGGWGAAQEVDIPTGAGFAPNQWHVMDLTVVDGRIGVALNGMEVTTWNGETPVTTGWWGPLVLGAASGDSMVIDNVLVEVAE
jgi:hypothetical protein